MTAPDPTHDEEERIRRVYEARRDESRYSWLARGQQLIMQSAERGMLDALRRAGFQSLGEATFLEIGCGTGHWLRSMVQWGARPQRIVGVDLLSQRIADARARSAAATRLSVASAATLPFRDQSFDVVLQSTVFTSILDAEVRRQVANEMLRVVRHAGVILWYDFFVDNPRNRDVRGVSHGELERLFPGCGIAVRRVTLVPPLARVLAPRFWTMASVLSALPFLCTHYVGTIKRPN